MIKTIWLCEAHYGELSGKYGALPILLIYNILRDKCEMCNETGEHLVDIDSEWL